MRNSILKLLILTIFATSALASTIMVSHKGAWKDHYYPQNTLAALNKAMELGFTAIEFDVQVTADGVIVLAHDDKISKISTCSGKITSSTLGQLRKCLITKNTLLPITQILLKKVKSPQPIATLKEVIEQVVATRNLDLVWIDFKSENLDHVKSLAKLLANSLSKSQLSNIVINSQSVQVLKTVKVMFPALKTSLEGKWGSEPLKDYDKYFSGLGKTHDVISLNVGFYLGHEPFIPIGRRYRFWKKYNAFIDKVKETQAPVIGWTVNKSKKIRKLIDSDIPFLLTDNLEAHY
jgi:glycerophosphoryl diester phosphodiesterase